MADIVPLQPKQPARLSRQEFKARAVALVEKGFIWVSGHIKRDHPERDISQAQIEKCILNGTVQTDPFVNQYGNYQAEMFRHLAGQELTVVVAIEWEKRVVVVTAIPA